jgi:hypothetical protein|nr:hypothetical protein [Kofleriaceae bacterium]
MAERASEHRFHFFRAGGVDQVSLRDAADLRALHALDHKLWVALAMPTTGVDVPPETLAALDTDGDKRIRVHEIVEAIAWLDTTLVDLGCVLTASPTLALAEIKDPKVIAAAKRILVDIGKPTATGVTVEDFTAVAAIAATTKLNGDSIITPQSTAEADLAAAITDALAAGGGVLDRSGAFGVDKGRVDAFFAAIDARAAYLASEPKPLGDGTDPAADAWAAVRDKLADYFTRARLAAFDPRASETLDARESDITSLAGHTLAPTDAELAKLPLAHVDPTGKLALTGALNPAWADRIAAFVTAAVTPILGARDSITADDTAKIAAALEPVTAWRAAKPQTLADALAPDRVRALAAPEWRDRLGKLIEADAAAAPEYDARDAVGKAIRLRSDFGRIVRNFVNFSDFYSRQDGIFQSGTLFLDARELRLCVPVADAAKHGLLAPASDSYLIYFDATRAGKTLAMAAALTNGDADNIFVGRNAVFYDRLGNDWDATVTKIVSSPISIREAFWSPYKKLVRAIEDQVTKRAAAADAEASERMQVAGKDVAMADKAVDAPEPPKAKIDLGTVAAIGVAIGGIGTLVGALLGTLFGLGMWLPVGIVALILMISGPAMLLAWLKLRRRNLGPILDANGWAVNGRARINVAFGAAMTLLARLPKGASRSVDDPFADKRTPWRRWVVLATVLILGASWYLGKLDTILPDVVTSKHVLGDHAPGTKPAGAGSGSAAAGSAAAPAPAAAAAGSGSGKS